MRKPTFVAAVLLAVSLLAPLSASAAISSSGGEDLPTLEETLTKGLACKQPADIRFISRVVNMVEDGRLPRSLVESTFLWARHKKPYPHAYFEKALKARAAAMGIAIN